MTKRNYVEAGHDRDVGVYETGSQVEVCMERGRYVEGTMDRCGEGVFVITPDSFLGVRARAESGWGFAESQSTLKSRFI